MRARKTKPLSPKSSAALDDILAANQLERDILDTVYDNTPNDSDDWDTEKANYLHEQIMLVVNAYIGRLRP